MHTMFRFLAVLSFSAVVVVAVAENLPSTPSQAPQNPQIDYPGFVRLSSDLEKVRAKRRVPLDVFQQMAKAKNTIILDTRSKAAFDEVHLADAVHLNFSDFTEQKLAKVIPNKNTRILIYCNNNFEQVSTPALLMKSAPLALNIPTFINLYGYGYENVYELADVVKLDDARLKLAGHRKTLPLAQRSVPGSS